MKHIAGVFAVMFAVVTAAQAQDSGFEKKSYNYAEWAKGRFSEVVTVRNPGKIIYLGGVGAEDENTDKGGVIRHLGDFDAQCHYAWDKIKRLLGEARRHHRKHRQARHLRHRHSLFLPGRQMQDRGVWRRDPAGRHVRGDHGAGVARHDDRDRRHGEHREVAAAPPSDIRASSLPCSGRIEPS